MHPLDSLIENCRLLLSKLVGFKIIKTVMKQNIYPDSLAKQEMINRLHLTIYSEMPHYAKLIFREDKAYITSPSST